MNTLECMLDCLLQTAYSLTDDSSIAEHQFVADAVKTVIERDKKLVEALRAVVATYSGGGRHWDAKEVARKALEDIGEG